MHIIHTHHWLGNAIFKIKIIRILCAHARMRACRMQIKQDN